MRTYFRRKRCDECHAVYDSIEAECPHCHAANREFERGWPFEHHLRDIFPWQIVFFLLGYAGFQVIGVVVSLIAQSLFLSSHPGAGKEELVAYLSQISTNFTITSVAYYIVFGLFILFLLIRKKMPMLGKSFAHWMTYVVGFGGGVLLLGTAIVYSMIAGAIFQAAGIDPSVNANESAIRQMAQAYPWLSILVFGLIGPFCEEMGYRVGLFGFTSRLGRPLAYVISAFVFGAIHLGWDVLIDGSRDAIIIEIVNFPSYLIAGFGLCLLYDRFGFGTSFIAHATNNLVSVILQIIPSGGIA